MPKLNKKKKVDSDGKFTNYQGVTILSTISKASFLPLQHLYQNLAVNKLILSYFALLPPESYHMTVNNLYVADGRDHWENFVGQNLDFFQSLAHLLNPANYPSQEINNKTFSVSIEEKFILGEAIQLRVVVPEELMRKFFAFGSSFNIQEGIPSIFHITLGYRYKDFSFNEGCQISEDIEKAVAKLRTETLALEFNLPGLFYFHNMEKFIEWDGQENPFFVKGEKNPIISRNGPNLFSVNNRGIKRGREEIEEIGNEYKRQEKSAD